MTKTTYVSALTSVLNGAVLTSEEVEKLTALRTSLEKKNSAVRKPTATQTANDGFKTAIADGMESDRMYTISELIKEIPAIGELTNQRVSAIVRQMVTAGVLTRTEIKRKAYFQLVEVAEPAQYLDREIEA